MTMYLIFTNHTICSTGGNWTILRESPGLLGDRGMLQLVLVITICWSLEDMLGVEEYWEICGCWT